uniref:Crinkler effector protein N-terminal domain-containing protein n=1 Tax=Phytophthora ramorum TaxID=164328 RepID=H3HAF1_PHYRM
MVKLFCAIVGVAGSAFSVRVDESDSVDDLKKAIKGEKPNDYHVFLAKTDGAWLSSLTEDVKKLKKGEKTALVEAVTHKDNELQGEDPISEYLEGIDAPKVKQIHVLVVVPEQQWLWI